MSLWLCFGKEWPEVRGPAGRTGASSAAHAGPLWLKPRTIDDWRNSCVKSYATMRSREFIYAW